MTDSSSDKEDSAMTEMAGESLTHLLKFGSFHMEIVPSRNIDVEKIFKETIADLHTKFGDKILEIDIKGLQQPPSGGGMHG